MVVILYSIKFGSLKTLSAWNLSTLIFARIGDQKHTESPKDQYFSFCERTFICIRSDANNRIDLRIKFYSKRNSLTLKWKKEKRKIPKSLLLSPFFSFPFFSFLFSFFENNPIRSDFVWEAERLNGKKTKKMLAAFGQERRNFKFMHHIECVCVCILYAAGCGIFSFISCVHSFIVGFFSHPVVKLFLFRSLDQMFCSLDFVILTNLFFALWCACVHLLFVVLEKDSDSFRKFWLLDPSTVLVD